jgi:hypothetical protein
LIDIEIAVEEMIENHIQSQILFSYSYCFQYIKKS